MNSHMKTRILIVNMMLLGVLTGCFSGSDEEPYIPPDMLIRQQSETIIESIKNNDAKAIETLFCSYVREHDTELENEIKGLFEYIDGEIISYDDPMPGGGSGTSTAEDGFVIRKKLASIENICSSNGKTYEIVHNAYIVYKDKPDYVGVTDISIFDVDIYTSENNYPEEGVYRIYLPEMFE